MWKYDLHFINSQINEIFDLISNLRAFFFLFRPCPRIRSYAILDYIVLLELTNQYRRLSFLTVLLIACSLFKFVSKILQTRYTIHQ